MGNPFSFSPQYGSTEAFVAKFSFAGEFQWVNVLSGPGVDRAHGVDVLVSAEFDGNDRVFATGEFEAELVSGEHVTAAVGDTDVFLASLHANGNTHFLDGYGGVLDEVGYEVSAVFPQSTSDPSVFITGSYQAEADLGTGLLPIWEPETTEVFIAAYNINGNPVWSQGFGSEFNDVGFGIDASSDSVVITGRFEDEINFGGGVISAVDADGFVASFETNGNHMWSVPFDQFETDTGWDVAHGHCGKVFVTGSSIESSQRSLWLWGFDASNGSTLFQNFAPGYVLWPGSLAPVGNGVATDESGRVFWTAEGRTSSAAFLEGLFDGCTCFP
jgi:hypothetical protein